MTRKQADQWAVNTLTAMLTNPALRLSSQSALQASQAMSQLTGFVWLVKRAETSQGFYWRAYQTETKLDQQPINKQIGGSL